MDDVEINYWEIDPFWNLADTFLVWDAAALIAGFDPKKLAMEGDINPYKPEAERKISTVFSALTNAINAGRLKAKIRYSSWERGWDEEPDDGEAWSTAHMSPDDEDEVANARIRRRQWIRRKERDWEKSTIDRKDLTDWLESRQFSVGFFFQDKGNSEPGYLDPNNPCYAPKLAAVVRAWQFVSNADIGNKTPKQAINKWLREHAAEFGLTNEDGNPMGSTIDELSTVPNWDTDGGRRAR